jgi:hypothetical protein
MNKILELIFIGVGPVPSFLIYACIAIAGLSYGQFGNQLIFSGGIAFVILAVISLGITLARQK